MASTNSPGLWAVLLVTPLLWAHAGQPKAAGDAEHLRRFEQQVEELRKLLCIPGLSAAILRDQELIWARGFGQADAQRGVAAVAETPFHIASLTKTLASTLIMQLVEQGKLDLDEPVRRYSADFPDDRVRVRHLLTHTSEGTPGERYQYNGNRYAYLTLVIERHLGKPFRDVVVDTFLEPVQMGRSVPGHDVLDHKSDVASRFGPDRLTRYERVLEDLARPYRLYGTEMIPTPYPPRELTAAAGIISTVLDLAKYDVAIDRHRFLQPRTQELAWTAALSPTGKPLPHALGWFAQSWQGQKLVWHYGHWPDAYSALYLKVPDRALTLLVLANSDALSAPFYATGGVETSPFASSFLRLFVFEGLEGRTLSDPHWTTQPAEFAADLTRLRQRARSYSYQGEAMAHTAALAWLEGRRREARTPVKLDPSVYDHYVGRYRLRADRVFTVRRDGDRLLIDLPRGACSELFPASERTFFLKVMDAEVTFSKLPDGSTDGLEIRAHGNKLSAKRIP
jgi:CubicO group peptidase (beta-lactamase class C family)